VLELVLASLDEPRKPKPGLTRIRRNLFRRGQLSRITSALLCAIAEDVNK
jgi:LacI family fructose operon transcriptional repressor